MARNFVNDGDDDDEKSTRTLCEPYVRVGRRKTYYPSCNIRDLGWRGSLGQLIILQLDLSIDHYIIVLIMILKAMYMMLFNAIYDANLT